jgi:hypothetical protein
VPPDVRGIDRRNDAAMSAVGRFSLQVEMGPHGPSGTARDETGRLTAFSGWLQLIALLEAPVTPAGALTPRRDETGEETE